MTSFGDLPAEYSILDKAKVVIIQVPYDRTSTWLKGADKGPAAIIEASANMELYDIQTDSEVYKIGIFTAQPVNCDGPPEEMIEAVTAAAADYIEKDKFVVTIGGEHSVSIGAVKAHAEHYKQLTVLQLDAHADLRPQYNGSKYNHACVMARVRQICPIVQVGVRSMDSSEKEFIDKSRVFYAEDIYNKKGWISEAIGKLSEKVYITIDLDVFDPSIMPSSGTPEPGGLLWYDMLDLTQAVIENRNVVGFDVVELLPDKTNKSPDFMAAKLIYKLLSYKFREQRHKGT
jgi:agmatinase